MATGCSFVADGLPSLVSGQRPTFSYRQTSHSSDYLGVQMTFMTGTSTCYGAAPTFSAHITNAAAGFSRNCIWNYASSRSYTALLCTASVTDIPNGPLTITYNGAAANSLSPRAFIATFGTSPAGVQTTTTATTTVNTIATTSLSAQPAATVTVTRSGTPITRQNTLVVTRPTTSTSTMTITSCSSTPRPSSSTRISSSTLSSTPTPTPTPRSSSISSSSSSSLVVAPSPTPTASTSPFCPDSDGTTFSTSNGDFVIECYYDRFDSNFGQASPQPSDYAQCMNVCASTTGCQAVSYVPNGPCYLKYDLGAPSVNGNIWGARLAAASSETLPPASIPPSPTATGPGPRSTVSCPASDGFIIRTDVGDFQVECGTDRSNFDMAGSPVYPGPATYEGCVAACASRTGCRQVSYIPGGPCYLKSNVGYPNKDSKGNVIGGRLLTGNQVFSSQVSASSISATPMTSYQTITVTTTMSGTVLQCTCAPTDAPTLNSGALICPFADGMTYTSDCGATYMIECSSDRYGNDLPGTIPYVSSLSGCLQACDNTPGCIDVSYSPGTPGPCYMKGVIGPIRQNFNIWGGRQLSGCTSNMLGLHRKRVVRDKSEKKPLRKRAPYGPDFTYIVSTTTATQTVTRTSTTSTLTVTPSKSGTSTTTVFTTAVVTAVVTSAVPSRVVVTTTVTTCPANRFF